MITIKDLRKDNNAYFSRFADEVARGKQLAALDYIEKIANVSSTNISEWDIEKIFFDDKKERLIEHKGTINTRMAQVEKSLSEGVCKSLSEGQRELLKRVAQLSKESKNRRLERSRNTQINFLQRADTYAHECQDYIKRAYTAYCDIKDLEGVDMGEDAIARISKICAGSFFKLHDISGAVLTFNTPEITLTQKNVAANIDMSVPMGSYIIRLNAEESSLYVLKGAKNIRGNYHHPYVNGSGNICWGNAQETANSLLSKGHWDVVFELLHGLLTTYTPEATPYRALDSFDAEYKRMNDTRERCICCNKLISGQPMLSNHESFCDCRQCEHCGRKVLRGQHCPACWCDVCEEESACEVCHDCGHHMDECDCE
jgi:hypothetical protein